MRLLAATLICLAAPACAEGWQVMFLTDSGGSRPMQVDPADMPTDATVTPLAYVDNDRGERLFVACHWVGPSGADYDWTLRLFPGRTPPVMPEMGADGARFMARFDGAEAAVDLGPFSFVQEAFLAPVPESLVAQIRAGSRIRLTAGGYEADFTLSGATVAINASCPAL